MIFRQTAGAILPRSAKLLALLLIAWIAPPSSWIRIAKITAVPIGGGGPDPDRSLYARVLAPEGSAAAFDALGLERGLHRRLAQIQILALVRPWPRWRTRACLHGEAYLRAALDQGRGAILWMSEFAYSDLAMKVALHAAGYRLVQLSRPEHGFAGDRLAVDWLNHLWTGVEDRYLAERVVIKDNKTTAALAVLEERLRSGGIVVITVGHQGRRTVEVPFLGDRLHIASGPIALAIRTGAALLPVHAVAATDPSADFDIVIDPPLAHAEAGLMDPITAAAADYARRLAPYVRGRPGEWRGWHNLVPRERTAEVIGVPSTTQS